MTGESSAEWESAGRACRCRSRCGRFSALLLSSLCAAAFRPTLQVVAGIMGAAAVPGIGMLSSVSSGCWTKSSPVHCRSGGCLLLWRQQHRLGEALNAADEFGA